MQGRRARAGYVPRRRRVLAQLLGPSAGAARVVSLVRREQEERGMLAGRRT